MSAETKKRETSYTVMIVALAFVSLGAAVAAVHNYRQSERAALAAKQQLDAANPASRGLASPENPPQTPALSPATPPRSF